MKARVSRPKGVALLVVLAVVLMQCIPAAAFEVFMDDFNVTRNGTLIFDDSFNRTAILFRPSATAPDVPNFLDNGVPATYFIGNRIFTNSVKGGEAILATTFSVKDTSTDPTAPAIDRNFAILDTGISGAHVLTAPTSFLIAGVFDIPLEFKFAPPAQSRQTINIFLSNRDDVL